MLTMMLAVKVPQLPVNNTDHLEATNSLCIMFAMQRSETSVPLGLIR